MCSQIFRQIAKKAAGILSYVKVFLAKMTKKARRSRAKALAGLCAPALDFEGSLALFLPDYVAIMGLFVCAGLFGGRDTLRGNKKTCVKSSAFHSA